MSCGARAPRAGSRRSSAPAADSSSWRRPSATRAASHAYHVESAIALAQRFGSARGLEEIARIRDRNRLKHYPFYHAAVAEFELRLGRPARARDSFAQALKLARNPAERRFLQEKAREANLKASRA